MNFNVTFYFFLILKIGKKLLLVKLPQFYLEKITQGFEIHKKPLTLY